MGWVGYLLGPTLRAPYGANKSTRLTYPPIIALSHVDLWIILGRLCQLLAEAVGECL